MKVKGNGQAKVLNSSELERLFDEGLTSPHLEVSAEQKRAAISSIGF